MRRYLVVADAVRGPRGRIDEAMLVEDGKVAAVGPVAALRLDDLPEERFPGATVIPGLIDAHFHPVGYTAAITSPSLKQASDFADLTERLRDAADELPPGAPLGATRLDDTSLAEGRLPDRAVLDAAVPDRPVLIHRYDGHVAIANTAALDAAGIGPGTPDPPGGSIDRDDGVPTGVLRETAVELVSRALPPSLAPAPDRLVDAMRGLARLGITGIGAIVGCGDGTWSDLGDELELIAGVARSIPIKLDVFVIAGSAAALEEAAVRLSGSGPRVRFAGLKRFADGSFGGHTAAMRAPFADRPGTRGLLRLTAEDERLAEAAVAMGARVAIHAIGDRAVGETLGVFERLVARGADPALLRMEHVSVIDAPDRQRMAALGVTASVQPAFLASETGWVETRMGRDRMADTYPLRSMIEAGIRLAGGSDCPVEPPHPLRGMAVARDRAGIVPEEGLDPDDALDLFTAGSADSVGRPAPLAVGSPADFIVLDRDPVVASPDEVRDAGVLATFVDGYEVAGIEGWEPWRG